mgnify:CR=1 FL=1
MTFRPNGKNGQKLLLRKCEMAGLNLSGMDKSGDILLFFTLIINNKDTKTMETLKQISVYAFPD